MAARSFFCESFAARPCRAAVASPVAAILKESRNTAAGSGSRIANSPILGRLFQLCAAKLSRQKAESLPLGLSSCNQRPPFIKAHTYVTLQAALTLLAFR